METSHRTFHHANVVTLLIAPQLPFFTTRIARDVRGTVTIARRDLLNINFAITLVIALSSCRSCEKCICSRSARQFEPILGVARATSGSHGALLRRETREGGVIFLRGRFRQPSYLVYSELFRFTATGHVGGVGKGRLVRSTFTK